MNNGVEQQDADSQDTPSLVSERDIEELEQHDERQALIPTGHPLGRTPAINLLGERTSSDEEAQTTSNQYLLGTAFVTFMSFALVQLVFSFIADSEAMKGDSAAMIVDALTYLFNWIAEYRKDNFDLEGAAIVPSGDDVGGLPDEVTQGRLGITSSSQRAYRKAELQLEIIPPLLSVATLVIVTVSVTFDAIKVLSRSQPASDDSQPNVDLMFGFSTFNVTLDFINVLCFAKARHLFGYRTVAPLEVDPNEIYARDSHFDEGNDSRRAESLIPSTVGEDWQQTNLNMCSAYTHVLADTLRSLAVILASGVAKATSAVTPEEADALAAIAVSFLIAISLVPLCKGLVLGVLELSDIYEKEAQTLELAQNNA